MSAAFYMGKFMKRRGGRNINQVITVDIGPILRKQGNLDVYKMSGWNYIVLTNG